MITTEERIEKRVVDSAKYFAKSDTTMKKTGAKFGVSESTIQYDFSNRLPKIDAELHEVVEKKIEKNAREKYIRAGEVASRRNKDKRFETKIERLEKSCQELSEEVLQHGDLITNANREINITTVIISIILSTLIALAVNLII